MTNKNLTLVFLLGLVYMNIEVTFGAALSGSWSLQGSTSLWMVIVGGLLGLIVGSFNEVGSLLLKTRYKLRVFAGMLAITVIELLSGLILNKLLGFGLWDYSQNPFNFLGQIDLVHSVCWLVLTPLVFWIDDTLRFYFFQEEKPSTILRYYIRAFWPQ